MALGRFRFLQRWSSLTAAKAALGADVASLESRDRDLEDYLSSVGLDIDALRALSGYIKGNGAGVFSAQAAPIPATDGGTGQTGYAVGDLLYASTTTALSKLADVATGNALISGGVSTAPAWGKVGLTTHVSGTLPIANGGTGQTSASAALSALGGIVTADRQEFTADGTWTKPAGAKVCIVECVGGGGGGGSGRRGASGANRWGGGGGGGGTRQYAIYAAADLGSTETVTIGQGGAGGAAQTVNSTNGNAGTAGTTTSFGGFLYAYGGAAGAGGTTADGTGGADGLGFLVTGAIQSGYGGDAHVSADGDAGGQNHLAGGGSGGGGGGGVTSGNTPRAGGVGGAHAGAGFTGGTAGTAGASGGAGGNGSGVSAGTALGGGGGGGGGGGSSGTGGDGGDGGAYGAGGGGGGAGTNSNNSGAGGDGADGICVVTTLF